MEFYTIYYLGSSQVVFYNNDLDIEVITENVDGVFNQCPLVEIKESDLISSIGKYGMMQCEFYVAPENVKIIEC